MNENLMSSKFIISVLSLVFVFAGFIVGKISVEVFMPFVLGILGIYTGGNVVSKFADKNSAN